MIKKLLAKAVYKALGWTYSYDPELLNDPKQVLIGFPHTSNRDGILAIAMFNIVKLPYHVLVKKELFTFPQGLFLRKMGCIPIDRMSASNVVAQMTEEFAKHKSFALSIAPEATRAKNGEQRTVKTGFWHIAKASNVPIVLMRVDLAKKHAAIFDKIHPSNDMHADLLRIQAAYAKFGIEVSLAPS